MNWPLEKEAALGQTYLIADEAYIAIEDLVKAVAQVMGVKVKIPHFPFWPLVCGLLSSVKLACKPLRLTPPIFRRRADWYRQNRAFTIAKAKKELGYNPEVGLTEGLTRTYDWYRTHGYL